MPPRLSAYLLLAAMLQCATGAPVEDTVADSPAGDTSGDLSGEEEETSSDPLKKIWELTLEATKHHQAEFEDEFHNNVKYLFLDNYKLSSLPQGCLKYSKQASLQRMVVQDLLSYTVYLKYVEKVYPGGSIASNARSSTGQLIEMIKSKMRNPGQVTALTSSQEEQLLRDIDNTDTFQRKMRAHSILYSYRHFLIDCKREIINKREKRSIANRGMAPVSFYYQK